MTLLALANFSVILCEINKMMGIGRGFHNLQLVMKCVLYFESQFIH